MISSSSGRIRPFAAILAALLASTTAGGGLAAGLTVEANARRADGGALSQLEGGARLEVEALLRNPGPEAVRLLEARLVPEGPAEATGAEAPGAKPAGRGALGWGAEGALLASGETRRLVFSVEIPPEAAPDAEVALNLTARGLAGAEAAGRGSERAALRAETAMRLRLAPVRLVLERALPPESSNPLIHGDALRVILGAEFPAGRARNVTLAAAIPPSARSSQPPTLASTIGADLRCSGGSPPEAAETELIWRLGDCRLAPGASASGRRVELSGRFVLRDADPFQPAAAIAAHRAGFFSARLEAEGRVMGESSVTAQMGGPLIAGELLDPPPPEARVYEAGDVFTARYELRNLGDAPVNGLEIWVRPDAALDCAAAGVVLEPAKGAESGLGPCGASAGPSKGVLPPEGRLVAALTARVRAEASLDAPLRIGLDAAATGESGKPPRIRIHSLEMAPRPPGPPRLRVLDAEEWTEAGPGFFFARPGDGALLEAAFQPPRGVTRGTLALKARLMDEGDGASEPRALGPAPLLMGRPELSAESVLWEEEPVAPPAPFAAEGWRILRIPLGALRTSPEAEAPLVRARIPLRIDPADETARADRLIDLRLALIPGDSAESASGGIEAEEGIFVELREPYLALTVATGDSDRVIRAGESAEFSGDLCNLGEAGARGVVMTADFGPGWTPEGPQGIRLRRSDSDWPILEDAPVLRAETGYDPEKRRLTLRPGVDWTGDLGAAECLRLSFLLTAAGTAEAIDRAALFRLQPYETGGAARRYDPPPPVRIALSEARLGLGPGGESQAARGGALMLTGEFRAPDSGGPYEISWRWSSAAGLRWRVFDGTGRVALPPQFRLEAGDRRAFRLESLAPSDAKAGWTETLAMHAEAKDASGSYPAAARWAIRLERDSEAAAALTPTKTMALDRDCDGELADETPQDALFERFKDLRAGECLIFRIHLRNGGATPLEDVVVTETPQPGLRFVPGSATIGPTAEGFLLESVQEPTPQAPQIVWRFQGSLPSGAEAEARYEARAPGGM
ncbi:DUF11 domain-containing protein [Neomegalonema sp.]|uniref:DUF11 domain-containing protein n=1 Tax=Neomegalonema sp. TaxID=2039713 RepID=UPI002636D34D|nr:DUF11 domain-containing protein [Neomegalonema sp.]MDD2868081.1 DUF11 domain-containing protein [Neomegalonema sp.]